MKRLRTIVLSLLLLAACLFGGLCLAPAFRQLLWGPKYHGVPQIVWQDDFRKKHDPEFKNRPVPWHQKLLARFLPAPKDLPWDDLEDEERIEISLALIEDPCKEVRERTVMGIQDRRHQIEHSGLAEVVRRMAESENPAMRSSAAEMLLIALPESEAWNRIIDLRLDPDDGVRKAIAAGLFNCHDRFSHRDYSIPDECLGRATKQLYSPDPAVQCTALEYPRLWAVRSPSAAPRVLDLLASPDEKVRQAARRALSNFEVLPPDAAAVLLTRTEAAETDLPWEVVRDLPDADWRRLLSLLGQDDPAIRVEAIHSACEICREAVSLPAELVARSDDADASVRCALAGSVPCESGADSAVIIRKLLNDPSADIRRTMASRFAYPPFQADDLAWRDDLLRLANDSDATVRASAMKSLMHSVSPELWAKVDLDSRLGDPDVHVRLCTVKGLSRTSALLKKHQTALVRLLNDSDTTVALEVLQALGSVKPIPMEARRRLLLMDGKTLSEAWYSFLEARRKLAPLSAEEVSHLRRIAEGPNDNDAQWAICVLSRGARDADWLPAIMADQVERVITVTNRLGVREFSIPMPPSVLQQQAARAQSPDPDLRRKALLAVRTFFSASAEGAAVIRAHLEDENPSVRTAALESLPALGEHAKPAVPALIAKLANAKRRERGELLSILAEMGPNARDAVDAVLPFARSPFANDRALAARALSAIAPGDVVLATARPLLSDAQPVVRQAAIEALMEAKTTDAEAISVLVRLLDDPRRDVRWAAVQSFAVFGEAGAPAVSKLRELSLQNDEDVRESALRSLTALGDASLPVVQDMIARLDDRLQRYEACRWLAKFKGRAPFAVPRLLKLADEDVVHATVALAATARLGATADDVVPRLRVLIQEKGVEVDWHIHAACEKYGPAAAGLTPVFAERLRKAHAKDRGDSMGAIGCLAAIGPAASEALPVLEAIVNEEGVDDELIAAAREAIEKIRGKGPGKR